MIKKSNNRNPLSLLNIFNRFLIIASIAIILNLSFSWAKLKNTFIEPEIIVSGSIEYDQKTMNAKVTLEIDSSVSSIPIDSTASILTEGLLGSKYISISLGADDKSLSDGDEIFDTQPAVILEELIGKFLLEQF